MSDFLTIPRAVVEQALAGLAFYLHEAGIKERNDPHYAPEDWAAFDAEVALRAALQAQAAPPKLCRLARKDGDAWVPASEWMTEVDASWVKLTRDKPDEWRINEPLDGKKVAAAFAKALQPQATAWQTLSQQIQEAAIASGQKQRPRENNQGIASDAWLHPIGTCSPERNGENQHHEHRAGESDAKCADCECDSECTRVSGGGQVRAEQIAQAAAEPVAWLYFHNRAEPELSVDLEEPECIKSFVTDVTWKKPLYTTPPDPGGLLRDALSNLNDLADQKNAEIDALKEAMRLAVTPVENATPLATQAALTAALDCLRKLDIIDDTPDAAMRDAAIEQIEALKGPTP